MLINGHSGMRCAEEAVRKVRQGGGDSKGVWHGRGSEDAGSRGRAGAAPRAAAQEAAEIFKPMQHLPVGI